MPSVLRPLFRKTLPLPAAISAVSFPALSPPLKLPLPYVSTPDIFSSPISCFFSTPSLSLHVSVFIHSRTFLRNCHVASAGGFQVCGRRTGQEWPLPLGAYNSVGEKDMSEAMTGCLNIKDSVPMGGH